jgi:fatty-acyl-CoA synthase
MTSIPFENLASLLAGHPNCAALRNEHQFLGREQLLIAAGHAARALHHLGLRRGDALAVWLPNGAAWLQLLFAAAHLGLLVVPVSTRYKPIEVGHLLKVSRARLLVHPSRFLGEDRGEVAQALLTETTTLEQLLTVDDASWLIPFERTRTLALPAQNGQAGDLLCCFSTSGTTGPPKLAAHDHASITRHALQVARAMDLRPGDAMLCALPLFGVFGFMTALATLAAGASCVLMPVFDAGAAAQLIAGQHISHAVGADSMFDPMLKIPGVDFTSLRHLVLADFAGLSLQLTQQADAIGFRSSGTYGSSEVFSLVSLQDWQAPAEQRALAGGTPVDPAIEIRVVDPQTRLPVPDGQAGELQIRGPNVLAQYLNNPEATARALDVDGWFSSGDLATAQGRRFHYLARIGDSLRLRGYLVNPADIEACLMQHPAIAGAQVVGVKVPGVGDQAIAFVVLAKPDPGEDVLLAHCRQHMASYKVPQRVQVLPAFPSLEGPNGVKIQKRLLREMASNLLAAR